MFFIKQAEPIVRKIFGFDNASSLGSVIASGALLQSSMRTAANVADKFKKNSSNKNSDSGKSNSSKSKSSSNADRNTSNINKGNSDAAIAANANTAALVASAAEDDDDKKRLPRGQEPNANDDKKDENKNKLEKGKNDDKEKLNKNEDRDRLGAGDREEKDRNKDREEDKQSPRERNAMDKFKQAISSPTAKKIANTAKNMAFGQIKFAGKAVGAMVGAYTGSNPITDALTGYNYGSALTQGAQNLGSKAISGVAKPFRRRNKRNDVIQKYNALDENMKKKSNYSPENMMELSRLALDKTDVDKSNWPPDLKDYAKSLQSYRDELTGKFDDPNKAVLDTIKGIQAGNVKYKEPAVRRLVSNGRTKIGEMRNKNLNKGSDRTKLGEGQEKQTRRKRTPRQARSELKSGNDRETRQELSGGSSPTTQERPPIMPPEMPDRSPELSSQEADNSEIDSRMDNLSDVIEQTNTDSREEIEGDNIQEIESEPEAIDTIEEQNHNNDQEELSRPDVSSLPETQEESRPPEVREQEIEDIVNNAANDNGETISEHVMDRLKGKNTSSHILTGPEKEQFEKYSKLLPDNSNNGNNGNDNSNK